MTKTDSQSLNFRISNTVHSFCGTTGFPRTDREETEWLHPVLNVEIDGCQTPTVTFKLHP